MLSGFELYPRWVPLMIQQQKNTETIFHAETLECSLPRKPMEFSTTCLITQ